MGLSTLIKQIYLQSVGGSTPGSAASASGDMAAMLKYIIANQTASPNALEAYPAQAGSIGFAGAGAFGTRAGPAASSATLNPTGGWYAAQAMAFHPAGNFVASAITASPYALVWNFSAAGYGSKLADPSTLPAGEGHGVAWHPNGNWLAVAHVSSPYVSVYAFDKVGGTIGAKSSNPSTLPTGDCRGVTFSPDGNWLAVAIAASPYVHVYAFDPTTGAIGAKATNPGTLPTGNGSAVKWSEGGLYIAVTHQTSPRVSVYPWNGGAFGTKFTNPGVVPTNDGTGIAWRGDDTLFVGEAGSPYIHGWAFSASGFGTKFTNPGTLPGGTVNGVALAPAGNYVLCASNSSPYVIAYPLSETGFGTKLSDPGSLPGATTRGVAVRPSHASLHVVTAANNAGNSHYSYPFTEVGIVWTPSLGTIAAVTLLVETAPVRIQPAISGVLAQSILLKHGFTYNLQTDIDSLFVGPDTDGGTGKFKVVASGR